MAYSNRGGIWNSELGCSFVVSRLFISKILDRLYSKNSEGLHYSNNNPRHYTIFGFCEVGGALQQEWSMHANEDGSSSYIASRKRRIAWDGIKYLFVRKFLPFLILYIKFFFKG